MKNMNLICFIILFILKLKNIEQDNDNIILNLEKSSVLFNQICSSLPQLVGTIHINNK